MCAGCHGFLNFHYSTCARRGNFDGVTISCYRVLRGFSHVYKKRFLQWPRQQSTIGGESIRRKQCERARVEFRERYMYIYIYGERERERETETERYNVEKKSVEELLGLGRRRIIHHRQTFVRIAGHTSHTVIDEHVRLAYTRVYDRGRK